MRVARLLILLAFLASYAHAQTDATPSASQSIPPRKETVEVTATRTPEDPEKVPAPIEVFSGEELESRGATDLRSALAFATGVEIAPGGDQGPRSAVPGFWGLKEIDAFLLVVDGVPWGGAFNPALTSISLSDVDRVEVMRGPAPITYGATSFVGVIQVIHKDVRSNDRTFEVHGGSFGSGGGAFSLPIPVGDDWSSRLTVEGERMGFSDDREAFRRGHGYFRLSRNTHSDSHLWFHGDLEWLDQDPASPRARGEDDTFLSPLVPVDSNQNPYGAFLNDHRGTVFGGWDRDLKSSHWFTTISYSASRQDIFRGFLTELEDVPDNAHGWREKINLNDVYGDTHFVWKLPRSMHFIAGADYLYGHGFARGADFDYTTSLSGDPAPFVEKPADLDFHILDTRGFFGGYGMLEWSPFERLRFDGGLRLNVTHEHQQVVDGGAGTSDQQTRNDARAGGSVGALFTLWQHQDNSIGLYANYRDTFKPAAIDFGIGEDEEGGGDLILKPETSRSVEGGLKGRFFDRRLEVEASGFWMNFENLVVPSSNGNVPGLVNAGKERFKGFESEATFLLHHDVIAHATYSYHDSRFIDFIENTPDGPVQIGGNRIEVSPSHLAAIGIAYAPERGFLANIGVNYTGNRYLNGENFALAGGFTTFDVGAGFRTRRWELRVDGRNLSNRRDPVAESEFGDTQYYLMPSRRVDASLRLHF